jgi:predicted nucleic acid-binding protein
MEKSFELYEYRNNDDHVSIEIRDKKDAKILQSAIESDCKILITGDKDFFERKYSEITILTPRDFFEQYHLYIN